MGWDSAANRRGAGKGLGPLGHGLAAALLISLVLCLSVATGVIEEDLVDSSATMPTVTATGPRPTAEAPQPTATDPAPEFTPTVTPTPEPTQSLEPAPEEISDSSPTVQTSRDLYAGWQP